MRDSSRHFLGFGAFVVLGAVLPSALAWSLLPAPPRTPADVVYDYSVAGTCGTLTAAGERGFRRELAAITARFHAGDPMAARAARLAGWLRADLEWSNRGLGGFRHWCATEGQAAGRHLDAIGRAAGSP
jgi:hypothetical protein